MIQGLDLSHFQGDVNWTAVAASGVRFAWCKSSQGQSGRDSRWTPGRRAAVAAAGIRGGCYHFADLSQLPEANAANFASAIGALNPGELIPALDIEDGGLPPHMQPDEIFAWMTRFAAAFNAVIPTPLVLYTDHGTLLNRLDGGRTEMLADFPHLWLARYTSAADPGECGAWDRWTVWQWTQGGTVAGIVGNVDLNRIASEADLFALTVQDPALAQPGA